MLRFLLGAMLLTAMLRVEAQDKPVVYDPVSKDNGAIDQAVNASLTPKYKIIEILDSPAYVNARYVSGAEPASAITPSGEVLGGYVLVAYVIDATGHAVDISILKTTDPRLNDFAIASLKKVIFAPAQLSGKAIATTAVQEFFFKDPDHPMGFATTNIVLYQSNAVLTSRVSNADVLAAYIRQLQSVAATFFADDTKPEVLDIVVLVRPGKKARVWFVSPRRPGNDPSLVPLRQKLEALTPVEVQGGPVAFAITASLAGARAGDSKGFHPPIPKEWQDAVKSLPVPAAISDAYFDAVWPDPK